VHSDVGGGYEDQTLANITFQWMAKRAWDAGLDFDHQYLQQELGIDLTRPARVNEATRSGTRRNGALRMRRRNTSPRN
jgi:hypothetical protein